MEQKIVTKTAHPFGIRDKVGYAFGDTADDFTLFCRNG